MWFQITFDLVIWYSLLFNPVTEVDLHENHLLDSVSRGALTENESNKHNLILGYKIINTKKMTPHAAAILLISLHHKLDLQFGGHIY